MPNEQSAVGSQFRNCSSELGGLLRLIYEAYPNGRPLAEFLGHDNSQGFNLRSGAIFMLYCMGVVRVRDNLVVATSRDANFFLGSLSKFLDKNVAAIQDPDDTGNKYRELTKIYEAARIEINNRELVDQQPLNRHRIVNVLIKGRMKRDWRYQDVYLHFYHPEWDRYHLIGLSQHKDTETDEELAGLALRTRLRLEPSQYELEVRNPKPVSEKRISETNGALTEYTYQLVIVKRIHTKLALADSLKKDSKSFRWFTWDEIRAEEAKTGERIMFSTPLILKQLDLRQLPVSAPNAEDARSRASILDELGTRFTRYQLLVIGLVLTGLLLLQFLPYLVQALAGQPIPLLQNLASISGIVGTLITVTATVRVLLSEN